MTRRDTNEMKMMRSMVTGLLYKHNLDAHKAFEYLVKIQLEAGQQIPHFIKSVKDFQKVANELKLKEQAKQQEEGLKQQYLNSKKQVVEFIMEVDVPTLKNIYKDVKETLSEKERYAIMEIIMHKHGNDMKESYIETIHINTFKKCLVFEETA